MAIVLHILPLKPRQRNNRKCFACSDGWRDAVLDPELMKTVCAALYIKRAVSNSDWDKRAFGFVKAST